MTRQDIEELVLGWRCNIVRLPFNQELSQRADYLNAMDQAVAWIAACGAYTLLDLQWLSASEVYGHTDDGAPNYVAPLPNPESVSTWQALARRYQDEPGVLFDLFNEPHDRLPDDPHPLWRIDSHGEIQAVDEYRAGWDDWSGWARRLIDAIHTIHPRALTLVSGVNWGYDLRGVNIDGPNVVYSAHVYPHRPDWEWRDRFGFAGIDAPLFISEWGGGDDDVEWAARLLAFIEGRSCGWTAWSWSDRPRLVRAAQSGDYTPTKFGAFVRSSLRRL